VDEALVFTARMAAVMRAGHMLLDDPPIFRDDLALQLSGFSESEVRDIVGAPDPSFASVFRVLPAVRARATDDALTAAISRGVDQFVILGAGMDSTAWRRRDLAPDVTTFEVDRAGAQAYKRERIDEAGVTAQGDHRFVEFDFATDGDFVDALVGAGLDVSRPTLWSWLGVLVYLTPDQTARTLGSMAQASPVGSQVIMDFNLETDLMDERALAAHEFGRPAAAGRGEPYVSFYGPASLSTLVDATGWTIEQCCLPQDYQGWFEGRDDGLRWSTYVGIALAGRDE
jgi:methyltransferase (TIGR00027 family)